MGIYPSITGFITETSAQAAQIASALQHAAKGFRLNLRALGGALQRVFGPPRLAAASPLLRFDDDHAPQILTPEPDPWPGFVDCGSAGVLQALRLADVHASAAKCLDAADYALSGLRMDLAAIAPGLAAGLPDWPAHQPSVHARLAPVARYMPDVGPARRDLAA